MESIKFKLLIKGTIYDLYLKSFDYTLNNLRLCFRLFNLLRFVYYNEIRNYIKEGKGNKDKEINKKIKIKERENNNNKR